MLKDINPFPEIELPLASVSFPPLAYIFAVLNSADPVQVKSASCIMKVPADSPSIGAELLILKSVEAEPRVNTFAARFTEPNVSSAFLVIVVSVFNFRTVLLLVVTSSRLILPSTSKVPFDRLRKFAPLSVVPEFVFNKPV